MKDAFAAETAAQGDNDAIRAILAQVCELTQMGFAAVARVTEDRWIACQVLDKIEFGLDPGSELELKTTICDEIRRSGACVVIDHVDTDILWQTHHTPRHYGFKSYASFPIVLPDGNFYGTLCAIDPHARTLSGGFVVETMQRLAGEVADILWAQRDILPISALAQKG